jgi:hypothetical protein
MARAKTIRLKPPEALSHTNPYSRFTVPISVISPAGLAFIHAIVHERIERFEHKR